MGDIGIAFIARPQVPPCNVNWSSEGKWMRLAKLGFEKYFPGRIRAGRSEPFFEPLALQMAGIDKLKSVTTENVK